MLPLGKQEYIVAIDGPSKQSIRISNEGMVIGGKITDANTGIDLSHVVSGVTIWMEAGDITRADVNIIMPRVDVTAIVDSVTAECPCCGHKKELEEIPQ